MSVAIGQPNFESTLDKLPRGINLDIGSGGQQQPGWVGLDRRKLPNIDIVCDVTKYYCRRCQRPQPYIPGDLPEGPMCPYCGNIDAQEFGGIPLPDNTCLNVLLSHVLEHIAPDRQLYLMSELWRIAVPNGTILISAPYGVGSRFQQDPTHVKPINEVMFHYYAPNVGYCAAGCGIPLNVYHGEGKCEKCGGSKVSRLYDIYRPRPFLILDSKWSSVGNIEVHLVAVKDPKVLEKENPIAYS